MNDGAEQSFRRLQLRTLQLLGGALALSMGARLLFASPVSEGTLDVGRGLLAVGCALAAGLASEHTAGHYGVALVLVIQALNTAKALVAPPTEVATVISVFGFHRILPFCAAVFGGVRMSIAVTAWASANTLGISLWRRWQLAGCAFSLPTVEEALDWYRVDREAAVLWTELNQIWIATGVAVAIVQTHHEAIRQLVSALVARQRFISNMVRGDDRHRWWPPRRRGADSLSPFYAHARDVGSQNHEIRTPLVGVVGMTDILLTTPGVAADMREQLGIIHASGKALLELVNNILDLSRAEAHKAVPHLMVRRAWPPW